MSSIPISKTDKYTFINVFTLHDPANQEKRIDIMASLMSGPGNNVPGFVASALHRSLDGTKEAGQSLRDIEELKLYGKQAMELASMTPVVYEVAETFTGPDFK